jgi:hypothetical protein
MQCQIARVYDFTPTVRFSCAALCRHGSEMQQEFIKGTDTTVSIVHHNWQPAAWAATHRWRDMQTLEGFTHYRYRRRGLQRFAASGLIAAGLLDIRQPVAVFSPDCVGLTRSLGFVEVKLFRRADSDWIEVPM